MKKLFALLVLFFGVCSSAMAGNKPNVAIQAENTNITAKDYLSAGFATKNNDFETAAAQFEASLASNPSDKILLQNTYKTMLLAGNYAKAAEYATKYLTRDKHSINALMLLAVKAASDGDFAKASKLLDGVVQDKKNIPMTGIDQLILPFVRMWISAGEGNYDVAINMLDPHDSSKVVSGTFIDLQKALLFSSSGNNEEAIQAFTQLTGEKVIMPYNLAKSAATFYESIGNWDEAGRIYKQYIMQHPALPHFENSETQVANKITHGLYIKTPGDGLAEVMKETARLLFSNRLFNDGLIYIRLALMLRPNDDETIMLLASYEEEVEDFSKAVEIYNKINKDSDFYTISQVNKAEDLYKLDKKSEAKKILVGLAENIKAKYIPLVTLADLLRRDNQFKDAIKIYTEVLANIDQKSIASWTIFFARGMCYERTGDWKKAETDMTAALALNPNQPEVINYLAYSWLDRNQNLEKARDMLLKAVAMRPTDPQIIDSAGWALYKLKDYGNALIFIEKASELLPQDAVINDHLGDVYWMNGRHYEAVYQWQRSIKYGPPESSTEAQLKKKIEKGLE